MLHSKTRFAVTLLFISLFWCLLGMLFLMILHWFGVIGPKFDWRSDFINDEDFQVPDEVFA